MTSFVRQRPSRGCGRFTSSKSENNEGNVNAASLSSLTSSQSRINTIRQRKANLTRQRDELLRGDHSKSHTKGQLQQQSHDSQSGHSSPLYDRTDCAQLFDRIVPMHSLAKVDELLKQLEQAVKKVAPIVTTKMGTVKRGGIRKKSAPGSTAGQSSLPLSTVLRGMLLSTNPNNMLQLKVLEFILGVQHPTKPLDDEKNFDPSALETKEGTTDSELLSNSTLSSAYDFPHMEKTLYAARERAILNRMCWNSVDACADSVESRRSAASKLATKLQLHAATANGTIAYDDDNSATKHNAASLITHLMKSLPAKNYRSLCNLFETYVGNKSTSAAADSVSRDRTETLESIGSRKDDDCGPNDADANVLSAPLVAKKIKPFAIRKLSSHVEKLAGGGRYHMVAREIAEFFFIDLEYLGLADERYVNSQERWNESREKFTERIMNIQEALHPNRQDSEYAETLHSEDFEEDGDDDDVSGYKSFAREQALSSAATPTLRILPKVERDRRSHISFEALPLLQEARSNASTDINGTSSAVTSHMVFVDNLPIDVQEDTIEKVFSRCGDLVSITIFNRRPDLDPGQLSKAQILSRQKRQIKMVGVYGQRWRRPCTPVYGLVEFASTEGSARASDESLRIFGTLIDRHPVRSIPSSKMTRLFIEGIPDGHPCLDFEYQLGQVLDPDLFVCLDAGQNNRAMVGSCEIKFPSFELAYHSFQKLQNLPVLRDHDGDCKLNWIRSPNNAPLWWSRKLGFD
jgi:RNA recognition motif. (a.k.a. RRM, RBD, or RNP domain)